jgi:two-component system chemotaxis response regulator CheB
MGGPEAIRLILSEFPADGPACLIVQHMPERFTGEFARRLDETVAMEVREAAAGDPLARGQVLVAPGGRHLVLESGARGPVVRIADGEPVQGHRPSVDVLFESAARVLGKSAVAALLTGMGEDGAEGLLALANAGARTVIQDRASSVVWGMPGAALERGASTRVVPLTRMAEVLLELAAGHGGAPEIRPPEGSWNPASQR